MSTLDSVPIACSLAAGDAAVRVGEWNHFLANDIRAVKGAPPAVDLLLADGDDVLMRAVDLAERERACCPFFTFGIALDPSGRWLTVVVPAEASDTLTGLVTLIPGTNSTQSS